VGLALGGRRSPSHPAVPLLGRLRPPFSLAWASRIPRTRAAINSSDPSFPQAGLRLALGTLFVFPHLTSKSDRYDSSEGVSMHDPTVSTLFAVGGLLLGLSPILFVEAAIALFGEKLTLRR
jgi:hypothetical protein